FGEGVAQGRGLIERRRSGEQRRAAAHDVMQAGVRDATGAVFQETGVARLEFTRAQRTRAVFRDAVVGARAGSGTGGDLIEFFAQFAGSAFHVLAYVQHEIAHFGWTWRMVEQRVLAGAVA